MRLFQNTHYVGYYKHTDRESEEVIDDWQRYVRQRFNAQGLRRALSEEPALRPKVIAWMRHVKAGGDPLTALAADDARDVARILQRARLLHEAADDAASR